MNHGLSRRQFLTATALAALPFGAWAQDTAAIRKPIVELYAALESLMRTGQMALCASMRPMTDGL